MADFTGGPGLAAFLATFALVIGAIILFRSLNKHLRKVRTHPPEEEKAAAPTEDAAPSQPEVAENSTDPDGA